MTEPVKLSRERWEMLYAAKTVGLSISSIVSVTTANRLGILTVTEPLETNGITFLPATYMLGGGAGGVTPRELRRLAELDTIISA